MARREISMNEIVEMIYQWHKGQSILEISHSLGFDRKTVRRYVKLAEAAGLKREEAFPEHSRIDIAGGNL